MTLGKVLLFVKRWINNLEDCTDNKAQVLQLSQHYSLLVSISSHDPQESLL